MNIPGVPCRGRAGDAPFEDRDGRAAPRHRLNAVALLVCAAVLSFITTARCGACTVVLLGDGPDRVFTVNQEDWGGPWASWKPEQAMMLSLPAGPGRFARVIFSWNGLSVEGGMNERGLVYDFVSLDDRKPLLPDRGLKKYPGPLGEKVLAECTTVDEAYGVFREYEEPVLGYGAVILTDARGKGLIVVWDPVSRDVIAVSPDVAYFSLTPGVFGLGARFNDIRNDSPAGLDWEVAGKFARKTVRDVTAYTCIYDQINRVVRLYYDHDLSRFAEIHVDSALIPAKRFRWVADLMPGSDSRFRFPVPAIGSYAPIEQAALLFTLIVAVSIAPYLFIPRARRRMGLLPMIFAGTSSAAGILVVLALSTLGRLLKIYGWSILGQLFAALPWSAFVAASTLTVSAALCLVRDGRRPGVPLHLLAAGIGLCAASVYVLTLRPLY